MMRPAKREAFAAAAIAALLALGASSAMAATASSEYSSANGRWVVAGCSLYVSHTNGSHSGVAEASETASCSGDVRADVRTTYLVVLTGGTGTRYLTGTWFPRYASTSVGGFWSPETIDLHRGTRSY